MVSGKDYAVGLRDGNPACRFQGLCRLVDEEGMATPSFQYGVCGSCKGACHYARHIEEVFAYTDFKFFRPLAEACDFLMEVFVAPLSRQAVQLADVASYLPKLGIVGVGFEAAFIAESEHFVGDACRISNAEHLYATVCQLLADPVDGGIALCTDHHLGFPAQHFVDGFHECGGFSRSRWSVDDEDILGA